MGSDFWRLRGVLGDIILHPFIDMHFMHFGDVDKNIVAICKVVLIILV